MFQEKDKQLKTKDTQIEALNKRLTESQKLLDQQLTALQEQKLLQIESKSEHEEDDRVKELEEELKIAKQDKSDVIDMALETQKKLEDEYKKLLNRSFWQRLINKK